MLEDAQVRDPQTAGSCDWKCALRNVSATVTMYFVRYPTIQKVTVIGINVLLSLFICLSSFWQFGGKCLPSNTDAYYY